MSNELRVSPGFNMDILRLGPTVDRNGDSFGGIPLPAGMDPTHLLSQGVITGRRYAIPLSRLRPARFWPDAMYARGTTPPSVLDISDNIAEMTKLEFTQPQLGVDWGADNDHSVAITLRPHQARAIREGLDRARRNDRFPPPFILPMRVEE